MMSGSEVRRVVGVVRARIDAGRYLPGEELWPAQLTPLLGVERRVVVEALRELADAGITQKRGRYWVASRRHPRMRGLSRFLGYWLWSDHEGRTFVGTTRAGVVVAKLADEDGHVVGDRVRIVSDNAPTKVLSAIRRGHPRAIEQTARKARERACPSWEGDVEVVRAAPAGGPALTWLGDTSRPELRYASWRHGAVAGELIIGSEVTRLQVAVWPSVDGEPDGPGLPVTGFDERAMHRWVGELRVGAYLSIERLLSQLGTSNLTRLSRDTD